MQKWKVEYRRSLRKPTGRRGHVLRSTSLPSSVRGLWESNTEYSDTSVDQVVQDFFHNVTTLESDCGGEDSDLRRNLSTLSVTPVAGASAPPDSSSALELPASSTACRKMFSRQKSKKRRSKRKWRAAAKALGEHHDVLRLKRRKCGSPIARPRRGVDESSKVEAVADGRVGSAFTSSEDESLARLFASGVQSKVLSVARMGGDEVCSSVCVTESELSDTPWEESCDADDELSCLETPRLHACLNAMGRCDGDVEDESETAASDQDKQWTRSHFSLSLSAARRPLRRALQTSPRHFSLSGQMMPSAANSLAQINRLLAQFVSGERRSDRYLRLPPMNRPARRIVWRLATLYNLQCHTERTGRLQYLLLAKTAASRLPEAGVLEQLCQRASLTYPIPAVPPVRRGVGIDRPLESEELMEPSDVSDVVNKPSHPCASS